jgi:hypothetical protein
MKVRPSKDFFDKIREAIAATRGTLVENKQYRKGLMKQITNLKADIRRAENVSSHAQTAQIDPSGFLRAEISRRQKMLQDLRQDLLAAELFNKMERSKFRIFHEALDNFDQAVDPARRRKG